MPKRATKAERNYMDRVADLGCIICRRPAEIHHITTGIGMGQRASNWDVIPLCPEHHRTGGYGVAIHAGKKAWELKHGTELQHLETVKALLA